MSDIKSFTDLKVWKEAHQLAILIYKYTEEFPPKEQYSLVDQMRRCSISITSNIAEGFSRQTLKEKIQFLFMARGSLTELQNQLFLSRDIGYLKKEKFNELSERSIQAHKMLNGLIKSLKAKR